MKIKFMQIRWCVSFMRVKEDFGRGSHVANFSTRVNVRNLISLELRESFKSVQGLLGLSWQRPNYKAKKTSSKSHNEQKFNFPRVCKVFLLFVAFWKSQTWMNERKFVKLKMNYPNVWNSSKNIQPAWNLGNGPLIKGIPSWFHPTR